MMVTETEIMNGVDAGIRRFVDVLRSRGVETFESCEGGEGHCFPEPTIRFSGGSGAGFKALAVALDYDLPVQSLRRTWSIEDGVPVGPHWEMVFWKKGEHV